MLAGCRWREIAGELLRSVRPDAAGRVLLASYYFPPDAAVGGLRLAKFTRGLRALGWEPLVVTVRDEFRDQGIDLERSKGLESVTVVRTREWPRVWKRFGWVLRREFRPRVQESGHQSRTPGVGEPIAARIKRWIISLAVLLPDDKKHWAIPAALIAVRLIRKRQIDYVITSGPPFSAHFIGLMARAFTRARWIADFRDPWIDMLPERFAFTRSAASDRIERHMEELVARYADTVIVTTSRMQEAFRRRYPSMAPSRFVCITNSIDADAFDATDPGSRYDRLTITYAGSLYFDRTPEPLFKAVSGLIQAGRIRSDEIQIKLVGRCESVNDLTTETLVRQYRLEGLVDVVGQLPYSEAIRIIRQSHLLLLLAPERHRLVVPAKAYDYLGSGAQILAIAEEGATADLIKETASGACFSEADVDGIGDYLESIIRSGSYRETRNDPGSFSRFHSTHLAGVLAGLMTPSQSHTARVSLRA